MSRIAILKLNQGSFAVGFEVSLRISTDNRQLVAEIDGQLPPNPNLEGIYMTWQNCFRRLRGHHVSRSPAESTPVSADSGWEIDESSDTYNTAENLTADCRRLVRNLETQMQQWLEHSGDRNWQRIREVMSAEIARDRLHLIIQAKQSILWKLPWHVWDLLASGEVGVSYALPEFAIAPTPANFPVTNPQVRILAVFGDEKHLNLEPDRVAIHSLQDATPHFLHQPNSKDFLRTLRQQSWEIFFFAGHSHSESDTGRIHLSETESLRIDEFKNALTEAIERGLKLAIFNSCDGLNLARELIGLNLPAAIVMQEDVPDEVAQAFLKDLLLEYAAGQELDVAANKAQKRLEDFQNLPGATWLPKLFQNIASSPPIWQDLYETAVISRPGRWRWLNRQGSSRTAILTALGIALMVALGLIFLRNGGVLETVELRAYDYMLHLRPAEPPDDRLLVIEVTAEDVDWQERSVYEGKSQSLSDRTLGELLLKLEALQPRLIGLDIYRDYQMPPEQAEVAQQLQNNERLVTICQVGERSLLSGRAPSPDVLKDPNAAARIGFSDVVYDPGDEVIRRHLFAMQPPSPDISPCQSPLAFNFMLALRYLDQEGITVTTTEDERSHFQLKDVVLESIDGDIGSYRNVDDEGGQLLLNYRSRGRDVARRLSLTEFLTQPVNPDWVKDKIVLIGTSDEEFKDIHRTPFGAMSGVIIQANAISQILSAVDEENPRPLLRSWSNRSENLWILTWAVVGGLLAWRFAGAIALVLILPMAWIIHRCVYLLLLQGLWIPLIPPVLALVLAVIMGVIAQKQSIQTALRRFTANKSH
ncbi:MAG: CHASE2 domain-containing protein [Jaaginema sp. PMC 1079.18]|nr:CHASE2 domain-containing protein [Jaaginema sp. PMC 1080.18]MEC4853218.1 CHASE2 domain-containing protein [Jaaginema sp. PMC 1079.18]MEC4867867.1 CHASE2 domain-containing protein [Jaaginema sp. PMC 1078.18]